jgi:hydroxyacylglutathione hydrolase
MSNYELHTIEMISTCSNCYLLIDNNSREALVLDPGCDAKRIYNTIQKTNAKLKYIVNTHGHWDHIGANMDLQEMIEVPILIHELDAPFLQDSQLNLAKFFLADGNGSSAQRLLESGDTIELGSLKIEVIHTPGHTPGGICLLCEDLLFTGDTLFKLSIGRSDLGQGNHQTLLASIADKLALLDDELIVLPGHGPASVLGYEKKNNPYFPQK